MIRSARHSKKLIIPETSFWISAADSLCHTAAMTDLWLHVNNFFIIVLIFFRYGSHIKKYMAVHFVCMFKFTFYSDTAIKFVKWFLFIFLPGTVKPAPANLCTVFLCTLLKRLQFSPKNVEFWTKKREIRPLRRSRGNSPSRLRRQPPRRWGLWHDGTVSG